MKKTKITRWVLITAACAVFLSICGISAFLTDAEQIRNRTVIGGNRIEVVEEFEPVQEIKPGTVIHKDVKIKNVGHSDCYVRVMAVFSDSDMSNLCTVDWNNREFVYDHEDGYYYYTGVLKEGEITPSLFTTIMVGGSAGEVTPFSIIIYAESYQANGFFTYQEAWQHFARNKE